jgi:hypothetical protein
MVSDQATSPDIQLDAIERGRERSLAEELADKYKASTIFQRLLFTILIGAPRF